MKILFAGDSITKGDLGVSFVKGIETAIPGVHVVNIGRNGLTYNLIIRLVMDQLRTANTFDVLVLQGGYNDLLLPWFYERGGAFKFAYRTQLKKGHRPFDTEKHAFTFLEYSIQRIKEVFSGKIILAEIACLGENFDSPLNQRVFHFNKILNEIATREGIAVAHTSTLFKEVLRGKKISSYCLDSFLAVTILDRITHFFVAKRHLHLTIDGVHLNQRGAELYASAILKAINYEPENR